jgi:hypothetical protein
LTIQKLQKKTPFGGALFFATPTTRAHELDKVDSDAHQAIHMPIKQNPLTSMGYLHLVDVLGVECKLTRRKANES